MIWWRGEKGTGAEEPTLSWAFRSHFHTFMGFQLSDSALYLVVVVVVAIDIVVAAEPILETFWMIKVFSNDYFTDCQVSDPAGKKASGKCSN